MQLAPDAAGEIAPTTRTAAAPGVGGGGGGGCSGLFCDPWGGPPGSPLDGIAAGEEAGWLASGSVPWYSVHGGYLMLLVGYVLTYHDNWDGNISGNPAGDPLGTFDPAYLNVGSVLSGYSGSSYTFSPLGGGSSILSGSGVARMAAYHPPAAPQLLNDPACWGAPDAVSNIHSLELGIYQNGPQGFTDGAFGSSIWQSTTQGNKPFGNAGADAGFNAGFMALDYAIAVANCRQGY